MSEPYPPDYRVPVWWKCYQDEFPEWRAHKGTDQLYYARLPGTDPLAVVRGESPDDLRDQIKTYVERTEE